MSDTPRTDAARISAWGEGGIENSIGFSAIPVEFARQLERELAEVKEQLRLCNIDQFATAAELAEAKAQRDLAVEALEIIKECFTTEAMFSETATAAMTARMIKKVLKECGE